MTNLQDVDKWEDFTAALPAVFYGAKKISQPKPVTSKGVSKSPLTGAEVISEPNC